MRSATDHAGLWLRGMAMLCFAAVGFAVMAQYRWDMLPCPWCTLQRLIYLVIGALAMVGAWMHGPLPRRAAAGTTLLLSAAGMASALWQHLVAAASASCNLTLADKILKSLGLFDLAPSIFAPMASCADAAVNLLGVPFAYWSLALFGICAWISLRVLRKPGAPQVALA